MASRKLWKQSKWLSYLCYKEKRGILLGHPTNLAIVRHASLYPKEVNGEGRLVSSLGMSCFSQSLHTACYPEVGCEEGMRNELKAKEPSSEEDESDGITINRVNDFTWCGHYKNLAPQEGKNEPVKVVVADSLQDVVFASGKNEEILLPGIIGSSSADTKVLIPEAGTIEPANHCDMLTSKAGLGVRQFSTSTNPVNACLYNCGPYEKYVDWRLRVDKDKLPLIYNQFTLPCCWACAAATSLEWKHLIESGKLVPLSYQQLIDSVPGKDEIIWNVFSALDLVRNEGITSGKLYPFINKKGMKQQLPPVLDIKGIDGWVEVSEDNYFKLIALLQTGPAIVNMRTDDAFMGERKGLFRHPCYGNPDHSMVCVGYDFRAEPYWILQNSWGQDDGNAGYIHYGPRDYPQCDPFFQYFPIACCQPQ